MSGKFIASVSFGKDSLAMLLYILETGMPLDEVLFYDTGMEFEAIYKNRDKAKAILSKKGIAFTELKPENPFLYDMIERPVTSKQKGFHLGYGWCGGVCRWGTTWKIDALDKYAQGATKHYVGIALDEPERAERLIMPKVAPLAQAGMNEADCLKFCRQRGWDWKEVSPAAENGFVDLYDILDRVSSWCCANKNLKELRNIYRYLPDYWDRLIALQDRIERPMKKYKNKQYGEYGNLRRLGEIFAVELKGEQHG